MSDTPEFFIEKRIDIRRSHHTRDPYKDHGVRFYRDSPGSGILQFRTERLLTHASLNPSEMRSLAASLVAVADELEGK